MRVGRQVGRLAGKIDRIHNVNVFFAQIKAKM